MSTVESERGLILKVGNKDRAEITHAGETLILVGLPRNRLKFVAPDGFQIHRPGPQPESASDDLSILIAEAAYALVAINVSLADRLMIAKRLHLASGELCPVCGGAKCGCELCSEGKP